MKKKKSRKSISKGKENKLDLIILGVLLAVLAVEVFATYTVSSTIHEKTRPARLSLYLITDSTCKECLKMNGIALAIEDANETEITQKKSLDFSSQEARDLVSRYSIRRIPTIIVTGEIDKTNVQYIWRNYRSTIPESKVLVIESDPPYVDTSTGSVMGRVELTEIVDSACQDCASLSSFIDILRRYGVYFSTDKTIEYTTNEAQSLISKFKIQRVPSVVISEDILVYEAIAQVWDTLNATEKEGFFALHTTNPPYLDLSTGTVKGLVTLIMLTDKSCSTCYDVENHKPILDRFVVKVVNESTYDISSDEGKSLIQKYNITKVPTIILSPEVDLYDQLKQVWSQVGSVAQDGYYIFTSTEVMGTYKDLSTGTTVSGS